jgi:hypothetical protein
MTTPLDQLRQIFGGATHIKEDQAKLGLFACQGGENGFFTTDIKTTYPLNP